MNFLSSIFLLVVALVLPSLASAEQKMTFGRFQSRALFTPASSTQCPAPLVILVPGSGANGPEEMVPASLTGDRQDHSIFASFSEGLQRSHVGTLAIGKPGVEFFKSWDMQKDWFYDAKMYSGLGWQDLIENLHDAVTYAKGLPCVDANQISILGHSEGTQVAVDFASQFPDEVKTLLLIGFSGESLATTVDWQLFRRSIDSWIAPDVDTDHDGYLSKTEAALWPELGALPWPAGQDKLSFGEIESMQRANPFLQGVYKQAATAKIWSGVFDRAPLYAQAAALHNQLIVFTGELDTQTRPEESLQLQSQCVASHKANCEVHLIKGLSHAMSLMREPRKQKLVDATLGPVAPSFLDILAQTGSRLFF